MNFLSDEKTFLKKYHLDEAEFNRTGLKWEQLGNIFEAYLKEMPQNRALENYFSDCLRTVENVHSVITRLKDPERLIEMLIRKKIENKELEISSRIYNEVVTDLIEIRVLHLFKEDWEYIHEYITNKWILKEKPIAYARAGDDREEDGRDLLARFQEKGCDLRYHELGYRSITYLAISSIDNKTNYIKILSRSIFEEGWNTIDHVIRDSRDIDSPVLMQYLSHFSHRMADMADEMGSFLHKYMNEEQERNSKLKKEPEKNGKGNDRPKHQPEELKSDSKSKENEKAPSGMESALIAESSNGMGIDESTAAPPQEFLASLSNILKKRDTPQDAKQDENARKSEGLPDTLQASLPEQQPAVPATPAKASVDPKIQPGILDAQKNGNLNEQENSQKFTLSKLKQAIQGIAPKNVYQNVQHVNNQSNNGGDAKE